MLAFLPSEGLLRSYLGPDCDFSVHRPILDERGEMVSVKQTADHAILNIRNEAVYKETKNDDGSFAKEELKLEDLKNKQLDISYDTELEAWTLGDGAVLKDAEGRLVAV